MTCWQFAVLGAGGGAIVEVLAVFRCVAAWQDARRSHDGTIKRVPPKLRRYVDMPAHATILPARVLLGAAAAILLGATGQIDGPYGAVVIGCAAPVLLAQLGSIPQVAKAVNEAPEPRKQRIAVSAQTPAEGTASFGEGSLPRMLHRHSALFGDSWELTEVTQRNQLPATGTPLPAVR